MWIVSKEQHSLHREAHALRYLAAAEEDALARLQLLISNLKSAVAAEVALENKPGHEAAAARSLEAERLFLDFCNIFYAQTATTMTDLELRACIAQYWNDHSEDLDDQRQRANKELVKAVLHICAEE